MNVADSEVVAAILQTTDAELTERWEDADIILLNTCSIRDNAEQKVGARLRELKSLSAKRSLLLQRSGLSAKRSFVYYKPYSLILR